MIVRDARAIRPALGATVDPQLRLRDLAVYLWGLTGGACVLVLLCKADLVLGVRSARGGDAKSPTFHQTFARMEAQHATRRRIA
jgi:hypothetical protein